jgi:hypothetical protein
VLDKMCAAMLRDLEPADYHEVELVDMMIQAMWRSQKARQLQDECIDQLAFEEDPEFVAPLQKKLELYMRYQTQNDRTYQRYAAELRKVKEEKRKSEIGIVSQKQKAEQHETKIALANARLEHLNLRNRKLDTRQTGEKPVQKPTTTSSDAPDQLPIAA